VQILSMSLNIFVEIVKICNVDVRLRSIIFKTVFRKIPGTTQSVIDNYLGRWEEARVDRGCGQSASLVRMSIIILWVYRAVKSNVYHPPLDIYRAVSTVSWFQTRECVGRRVILCSGKTVPKWHSETLMFIHISFVIIVTRQ